MNNPVRAYIRGRVLDVILHARDLTVRDILLPYVQGNVLDVGCGTGEISELLLRHDKGQIESIVGLDPHLPPEPKIPVKAFDGYTIPFGDKQFDTVISSFILHHAEDPGVLLDEMRRVGADHVVVLEDAVDTPPARAAALALHDKMKQLSGMEYEPDGFHTPEDWNRIFSGHGFRVDLQARLPSSMPFFPSLGHHLFVLSDQDTVANLHSYEALNVHHVYYRIYLVYMVSLLLLFSVSAFAIRVILSVLRKGSGRSSPSAGSKKVN